MDWFKANAAAIQALSSVAGLLVAGVLAFLTAKYVRLTRDIAASNLEQVKYIREAGQVIQQNYARALESLALRIRVALGRLSSESPRHGDLRTFAGLTEQDIIDLQAFARQVNNRAISSASEAAEPLRLLLGMIQTAKGIDVAMGWIPTTQEATRWMKAMEAAHRALQEIETTCQKLVG